MNCVICRQGNTSKGFATITLERDQAIIVFRKVPADICKNCGEYYLSDDVAEELLNKAESVVASGAEVEIRRYAA
ncbi:type II toxin-antitoxin system MqsA family antitoxin [cf. Phormidesmis sp. LEGE 11477]|uniref:type II toxin-antitoxin system MqsA family antitoxin n=1 Tax=cf. Phormidesmis sp. LEGE 11477 TaxID=1828680 RepID=UPI00187E6221|nr:type II toxin-antitoxin system MqsA family antitoxin [cf. Phormidesmis sp. LEGE 11477]MBE9059961.1 type II toxin-antitoxin system MqsA family antitoxin [cf. Phormidesmis sp. LEGE 11477]